MHVPHTALALFLTAGAALAGDCQVAWNTGWNNDTLGSSHITANQDREVADDFDFTGPIGRIEFNGHGPLNGTYPIDGVVLRFYAWTSSGPGALQQQLVLAAGDPNLSVGAIPETIAVRLAQPFQASGKHFVSLQVDFAPSGGYWDPWRGTPGSTRLTHAWVRDNLGGGAWAQYVDFLGQAVNADASFTMWSAPTGGACSEWLEVATPVPNADYTILRAIDVLSASDVWSVGHHSGATSGMYTFAMHYDGNAWTQTPTPSPTAGTLAPNDYLWAVDGVAPDDVWAGGEQLMQVAGGWVGSQPFTIHWDGSSWSEVPSPVPPTSIGAGYTGSSVLEIEAIAPNDVWFLGRWVGPYPGTASTQPAMAMHWDGSGFSLVSTPTVAYGQRIEDADAYSSSEIWAIGSTSGTTTSAYPYVLRWDGSSWTQVLVPPAGTTPSVHGVEVLAPNDVWLSARRVVGTSTENTLLHYDGTSWTQYAAPVIGNLHAVAPNDLWVAAGVPYHRKGGAWSVAEGLGCIPWPSVLSIDGKGGALWAAGRQLGAGLTPLTLRYEGPCNLIAYCTAGTTSSGCVPSISGVGDPSASATSGFTIRVDQVEGQRAGLIFYGASGQQALPWASGGTSFLCVKSPTQRMGAQNAGGTFATCTGVLAQDWNAYLAAHPSALGNPRVAGAVFDAQGWFRDPPAPKTTNLSDGLHFSLSP